MNCKDLPLTKSHVRLWIKGNTTERKGIIHTPYPSLMSDSRGYTAEWYVPFLKDGHDPVDIDALIVDDIERVEVINE